MDKALISVIIPVYKVEKYLDKCVESIVNQTYKNLEILLVDDGSPDNCPKMCDDWAKKDDRIKVIHKENAGVSMARNTGIDNASGEYIAFVDSDDYILPTMYEKLLESAEQNNSDIVMCRFSNVYEDGRAKDNFEKNLLTVNSKSIFSNYLLTEVDEREDVIYADGIMGNVWRLLIKKGAIGQLRFEKYTIAEDLLFLIKLIKPSTKISVVDECLYCYLQRENSAMRTFNKNKIANRYNVFKELLSNLEDKVTKDELNKFKFYNYFILVYEMLYSGQRELLNEYLNDKFFVSLGDKENYLPAKKACRNRRNKLLYFLFYKKWFKLYTLLTNIKKKIKK